MMPAKKPKILPNGKFSLKRLFEAIEAHSFEIGETLDELQSDCNSWKQRIKEKGYIKGIRVA